MFKARIVIGNEQDTPQQFQQQYQNQSGQMVPYRQQVPTQFNSQYPVRQQFQAGDERWVETINYSKTSTNDTAVSLQAAADRQAGNNKSLNMVIGGIAAAFIFWLAGDVLVFGLKCIFALVAFYFGYQMFNSKREGQQSGRR